MAVKLITGLKTTADIESQDDGARIYGTISNGDRVLNVGNKLAYQTISNNCIRIKDGEALIQGRHVRQAPNTYTDVTINNGESGKKRYDIIVLRYTKAVGTGIENVELAVVEGTPATSSPTIPSLTTGNVFTGCTTHEMGLYMVYINGLNISSVTKLFTEINSMESLNTSYTNLNTKVNGMETTAEITYYVSPSGSNSNSGTSSSYPFKTITYALSKIPKCLKHNVTINLASGTYTESDVTISGFYGGGELKIIGNTATSYSSSSSYRINSLITFENNSCCIHLRGIQANNGIIMEHCPGRMRVYYDIIYGNSSTGFGARTIASMASVESCKLVNCTYAVGSGVDGYIYVDSNDYVNCSIFYHCNSGILLACRINSGSPTSSMSVYGYCGLIVYGSGAIVGS